MKAFNYLVIASIVALTCLMGCAVSPVIMGAYKKGLSYEPSGAGETLVANVCIDTAYAISPEGRAGFKATGHTDEHVVLWETAVADTIFDDFAKSRVFSGVTRDKTNADLVLVLRGRDYHQLGGATSFSLQLSCEVLNPRTGRTIVTYQQDKPYCSVPYENFKQALREVVGQIKAELVADFKDKDIARLDPQFTIKAKPIARLAGNNQPSQPTKFEDLLVAKEINVTAARQRNRTLIAFKTLTLPKLLREKKTAELTAMTVQIEQVILDLNHEAEMEKDRAQRALEQNPAVVEEHRELAVVYKERIEVLKPIGAAIKEEIANRLR